MHSKTLFKKYYNFPIFLDKYRCQDIFRPGIDFEVPGLKDEHVIIAKEFQKLNDSTFKYLKVKSNLTTTQIQVLASLSLKNEDNLQEKSEVLSEKIGPLCTSLHLVSKNQASKNKESTIELIKGDLDFMTEKVGIFDMKFSPFADIPINIEQTNQMLKIVHRYVQDYYDILIDFDCDAGYYGLNLGFNIKSGMIGLDNALLHLNNAKSNAKSSKNPEKCDFRLGANNNQILKILENLHYSNQSGVILLHPQRGIIIPNNVINSIIDCPMIKCVILFTSMPEIEAYSTFINFLTASSSGKRRFQLKQKLIFDMYPDTNDLQYVFVFVSK